MNDSHQILSPAELNEFISAKRITALLDVRSPESYRQRHIPGASSNSVFAIGFEERFSNDYPDHSVAVCVYGDSPQTHEARMAAEKLLRAGYQEVFELREGLEGWMRAGMNVTESPVPGGTPDDESGLQGTVVVDLEESRIGWTGRNLLNRHHGTLELKSGKLYFESGALVGGRFVLDMNAIHCVNLDGDPLHDVLVDHLRSHDFFDTENFPESVFEITAVRPGPGTTAGSLNLEIDGLLTLKGRQHPLTLQAAAGVTPEGAFAAQAMVSLDRTGWGVLYGSGKFFRNLGMHLVNDFVEVRLRVVAAPSGPKA